MALCPIASAMNELPAPGIVPSSHAHGFERLATFTIAVVVAVDGDGGGLDDVRFIDRRRALAGTGAP